MGNRLSIALGITATIAVIAAIVMSARTLLLQSSQPAPDALISPAPGTPHATTGGALPTGEMRSFLCPPASSSGTEWQCQENAHTLTRTCTPVSPPEPEWACYEDLKYGFAIEYPPSGLLEVSIPIDEDSSDGVTIFRRHSFMGPGGVFDVDIWPMSEPDLVAWMDKMREATGPDVVPEMEPNGRVGGFPAVAFSSGRIPVMFTVFVSNGTHTFKLMYSLRCEAGEQEIVRRIVDSFRFSAEPAPAEIPETVWQKAKELCEQPPSPCLGPMPTPLPITMPDAVAAQDLTVNWPVYENPDLGIRFHYPPEWKVSSEPVQQVRDPLFAILSVERIAEEGYREFLMSFLVFHKAPEASLGRAEDVITWIRSLPPELGFAESSVRVAGPVHGSGWMGWYSYGIEPWYPCVFHRVIIPGKEVMIQANIGDLESSDESRLDWMLPQQMVVLATLEVTR